MKIIHAKRRNEVYEVMVDDTDYEYLKQFSWRVHYNQTDLPVPYAYRNKGDEKIAMHRELTGAPRGQMVDHVDCNGLNNQRHNLRACSNMENQRNARVRKQTRKTSQFKGVRFHKKTGKFQARIYVGKDIGLGYYDNESYAARAYDVACVAAFGRFAHPNKGEPMYQEPVGLDADMIALLAKMVVQIESRLGCTI